MPDTPPATVLPFPKRHQGEPTAGMAAPVAAVQEAYRLLARHGGLTPAGLAAALGLADHQTGAVLAELASLRLIADSGQGTLAAVPPSRAVGDRVAEQAAVLARAVDILAVARAVSGTEPELPDGAGPAAGAAGQGAAGAAGRRVGTFLREPRTSVSALHPGTSFSEAVLGRSLAKAVEYLGRGVRMRVVHQSGMLRHPPLVAYLVDLAGRGCQVRLRDEVPLRLLLIDGTSALVVVPSGGCQVLVGERAITRIHRLVEFTWGDAVPLERALARSRDT